MEPAVWFHNGPDGCDRALDVWNSIINGQRRCQALCLWVHGLHQVSPLPHIFLLLSLCIFASFLWFDNILFAVPVPCCLVAALLHVCLVVPGTLVSEQWEA